MSNIFTYWENTPGNQTPPFIEYCLKTFSRSGCNVHVLNPSNIDTYLAGVTVNPNWRNLTQISQKVDVLRVAVVLNHGGVWVDADTIIISSFDDLLSKINKQQMLALRWSFNQRLLNGYFVAQKGAEFLRIALREINNHLDHFKPYYEEGGGVFFGECMFAVASQCALYNELPLSTFLPIEFPPDRMCWYRQDNIQQYIAADTVAIGLNLSQYEHDFKYRPVTNHINDNNLFGSIIRYSESLGSLL